MYLLWPGFLALLGLIPLLVAAYVWVWRRRHRYPVRYSSLALVREALPRASRLRRYLPMALYLAALASLTAALTRPTTVVTVPAGHATVALAIDVSTSMCSTDVQPTRLGAAKNAVLSFINGQKNNTEFAVVAFSTYAELVQPATQDQQALQAAVHSLTVGSQTAIGSAILKSLDAISEADGNLSPSVSDPPPVGEQAPAPGGTHVPDIIVLLTDGVSNTGPSPLDAARQAAERGVRVYTIGVGTPYLNVSMDCDGQTQSSGSYSGIGNSSQSSSGSDRGIDEATLQRIAAMTGGKYYSAENAGQLQDVYNQLPAHLMTTQQTFEVSFLFVVIGALLAVSAVTLSMIWHPMG